MGRFWCMVSRVKANLACIHTIRMLGLNCFIMPGTVFGAQAFYGLIANFNPLETLYSRGKAY